MAQGKRAGARPKRSFRPVLLVLALGVTVALVAWGYLVKAAVDFGTNAREGDSTGWWLLLLASLGATACAVVALLLLARISRVLGITGDPEPRDPAPPRDPDAPRGGRRAAR